MIKNYIPKTKDDVQAVKVLKSYEFVDILHDVPELLKWMQDMHWDVSHGIAEYFTPHVNDIKQNLIEIINSNDNEWKHGILSFLIAKSYFKLDNELMSILKRIAKEPTKGERGGA